MNIVQHLRRRPRVAAAPPTTVDEWWDRYEARMVKCRRFLACQARAMGRESLTMGRIGRTLEDSPEDAADAYLRYWEADD